MIKNILSIAGSDPSGGAGIQADLKTIAACGGYGMAAITALTAQNTQEVSGVHMPPAEFLRAQLVAIFEDIQVDAVKIGMAGDAQTIAVIADMLEQYKPKHIVLDPVMVATSGDVLLQDAAVKALKNNLIPMAHVLTPNLPEAQILCGMSAAREMSDLSDALMGLGARAVFLKGGHGGGAESNDLFLSADESEIMKAARIETNNTHGTGCTLSSAIATYLAQGQNVINACRKAKAYVHRAIAAADGLGVGGAGGAQGHGPLHHFYEWQN